MDTPSQSVPLHSIVSLLFRTQERQLNPLSRVFPASVSRFTEAGIVTEEDFLNNIKTLEILHQVPETSHIRIQALSDYLSANGKPPAWGKAPALTDVSSIDDLVLAVYWHPTPPKLHKRMDELALKLLKQKPQLQAHGLDTVGALRAPAAGRMIYEERLIPLDLRNLQINLNEVLNAQTPPLPLQWSARDILPPPGFREGRHNRFPEGSPRPQNMPGLLSNDITRRRISGDMDIGDFLSLLPDLDSFSQAIPDLRTRTNNLRVLQAAAQKNGCRRVRDIEPMLPSLHNQVSKLFYVYMQKLLTAIPYRGDGQSVGR